MTYQWTTDGRTIRGELDARQVAELIAAGNAPQPVTGYRCQRAGELHWGEYTAAEIAAMAAEGWECAEGEPWPPPVPPTPTLAELQAAALARVRAAVAAHILAVFPDWYQRNVALGIYPEAAQTACREGIAACIEASNAAEDAVAEAADATGIAAAEVALALPEIAR